MPMPRQGADLQNGCYSTPQAFIDAIELGWGKIDVDLAANAENCKGKTFISEEQDSLSDSQKWHMMGGLLWLNPPYSNIAPWVKKAHESTYKNSDPKKTILVLVPASVSTNWWADYVHDNAIVYFIRPRLSFDGKHPFPKDLALLEYTNRSLEDIDFYFCWKWK